MCEHNIIIGPPGTGKTRALLERFEEELDAGVAPERLAVFTYTKAARKEFQDRAGKKFGLEPDDDLPWVKTIHATCYRLLGLRKERVMNDAGWKRFAKEYGYALSNAPEPDDDFDPYDYPVDTEEDKMRSLYQKGRSLLLSPEQVANFFSAEIPTKIFKQYIERYEAFKTINNLLDFNDFISKTIEREQHPPVDVMIVDEGQDLSPLQIAAVEMWKSRVERYYIAGDPDQAIYGFQGANPHYLIELHKQYPGRTMILSQSYRVPKRAHSIAMQIIHKNTQRIDAPYEPTDVEGDVQESDIESLIKRLNLECGEKTFVAFRNRWFIQDVSYKFFNERVPYIIEGPAKGAHNPFSKGGVVAALRILFDLRDWKSVRADEAYKKYFDKRTKKNKKKKKNQKQKKAKKGVVERKGKTYMKSLGSEKITRATLAGWGWESFLSVLDDAPVALLHKEDEDVKDYMQEVIKDADGSIPLPEVIMSTIHGLKGREAETVVIDPNMTKATYAEYVNGSEEENRIAYVAVTRTKRTLIFLEPRRGKFYEYPGRQRQVFSP